MLRTSLPKDSYRFVQKKFFPGHFEDSRPYSSLPRFNVVFTAYRDRRSALRISQQFPLARFAFLLNFHKTFDVYRGRKLCVSKSSGKVKCLFPLVSSLANFTFQPHFQVGKSLEMGRFPTIYPQNTTSKFDGFLPWTVPNTTNVYLNYF